MRRYFTIYWRPDGWEHLKPGEAMTYAGGNQFRAREIKTGDRAYVLSLSGGQARLLGAINVTEILTTGQARSLGFPIWPEADEHLIGTSHGNFGIRSIPLKVAKQLRFITRQGSQGVKFDKSGQVDRQTLRGVRELTPDSTRLLDGLLGAVDDGPGEEASKSEIEQEQKALQGLVKDLGSLTDTRRRIASERAVRDGQSKFKEKLVKAYEGKCAVTGCDVLAALDGAHIVPYRGAHTNLVSNGLLLRTDIHALFDEFLMWIDPKTRTVVLDESIRSSTYGSLHGQRIRLPRFPHRHPDARLLAHRAEAANLT